MTLREILRYEPRPMVFGTSGLRGLVSDLTQLEVAVNVQGFLRYLLETCQVGEGDTVGLAGDLRPSTAGRVEVNGLDRGEILQAVRWAVLELGFRPQHLGAIPTPALMHYGLARRLASIMVTGSHIPFDRNGIKFNKPSGEVLKGDEPGILDQVSRVRDRLYRESASASAFGSDGMLRPAACEDLPVADPEGERKYLERYLNGFGRGPLLGRRILIYQHSAVGRDLLVDLLTGLGARVSAVGRSEEFIPIDTEAVQPALIETIQRWVDSEGDEDIEAVVSTDGDSDRPLLLGVENGRVRFIGGDLLGVIVAEFLGVRHVAVPISVNDAVDRFLEAHGVTVVKTKIGSPHVISALLEVGWEANGGFLTASPIRVPGGGQLSPLPTRDAFLPLLGALYAAFGSGRTLCQWFDRLPPRFGKSDLLRPMPGSVSRRIVQLFQPADPEIEQVDFIDPCPILRRRGSAQTQAASDSVVENLQGCRSRAEQVFSPEAGYAPVGWMNFLDGVRLGSVTGEVVHVRPSGNAPEMRVYATADSPERAAELARAAVAPDGVLRRLEAEVMESGLVEVVRECRQPLILKGAVQSYAWGGTGFIPALVGQANPEQRPWAELWLGAHGSGSAVATAGDFSASLRRLLERASPWVLGPHLVERFGSELPYLLKVLDAREMLSIQVHPTREQARAGFERETAAGLSLHDPRRNYRDPYPKPEVQVAQTPFWMLHGFRTLEELVALGDRVAELRPVLVGLREGVRAAGRDAVARCALLGRLYERVMTLPQGEVDGLLRPLIRRLDEERPVDPAWPDTWFYRAARRYAPPDGPCDRGLFSIFFLNLVGLRPGEGTFQDAGVPHAYLEGATVELMACSDNVLRGGLTPKHVDVPELLRIIRFEEGAPVVLRGEARSESEEAFATSAEEFELRRIRLQAGGRKKPVAARGPECLLVAEGGVRLKAGESCLDLLRGGCVLIPHGLVYELEGVGAGGTVMRALVP